MKTKTLPIILIILGSALLLGAVISALDNATAAKSAGLGKWIFDVLVALLGAGGFRPGFFGGQSFQQGLFGSVAKGRAML